MVGREDKRSNNRTMIPALKNNAAVGYQGPVKIELSTGFESGVDSYPIGIYLILFGEERVEI